MPPIGYKHTKETRQKMRNNHKGMRGRRHSEETKKKIGNANSGKIFSIEHRKKLSEASTRHKHTKETKLKLSIMLMGRKLSNETKKKISDSHKGMRKPWVSETKKGKKCHFWKGGTTSINRQLRNSYKTKIWRDSVFKRDNYTCRRCGIRSGEGKTIELHPHHIYKVSKLIKYNLIHHVYNPDNGITLCRKCHFTIHST